jgi:hypothetical protein
MAPGYGRARTAKITDGTTHANTVLGILHKARVRHSYVEQKQSAVHIRTPLIEH